MPHPSIIVDAVGMPTAILTSTQQTAKQKRIEPSTQPLTFTLEIERQAHEARQRADRLRRLVAQVRKIRGVADSTHLSCGTDMVHTAMLSAGARAELIAQLEECYFDAKLHAENLELHADYERETLSL